MTKLVATLMPELPADAAAVLLDPPPDAEYVELRLDALAEPTPAQVEILLGLPRAAPVIATCRAPAQGGLFKGSEAARMDMLAAAGEAGAEILDIEDTSLEALPERVPGERLASCHLRRFMPRLASLARRVAGHGTRFTKLAVPADTPGRLAELLDIQDVMGSGFALVPTGRLAEAGRVMAAGRGSALTYGAVLPDQRGHPDQPTCSRLHDILHVGLVGPNTRFFAVVGHPVGHSLSPAYHNTIFRGAGKDARMLALDIDDLGAVLDHADELRLDGFAVTHPHKATALRLAYTALPGARTTAAANTLIRTPAGWQARNTDWKAACDLLPRKLAGWRRRHAEERPRVLLLGAGGAARAIAVALFEQTVELAIWSRHPENATDLAERLAPTLTAVALPELGKFGGDVVINATPVGMPGIEAEVTIGPENFREGGFAVDLAYGSEDSPFRRAAAEAGVQLTTGAGFFVLQARRQAELFTGGSLADEVLKKAAATVVPKSTPTH